MNSVLPGIRSKVLRSEVSLPSFSESRLTWLKVHFVSEACMHCPTSRGPHNDKRPTYKPSATPTSNFPHTNINISKHGIAIRARRRSPSARRSSFASLIHLEPGDLHESTPW